MAQRSLRPCCGCRGGRLRVISLPRTLREPEEGRAGPASAGDFSGDLAEGPVAPVPIEEAPVHCRGHLVSLALPRAQEPRAGFDPVLRLRPNGSCACRSLPCCGELDAGDAGEAAEHL